ncbi:MAG: TIGR01777 family oxidoreductase [Gallionella sp.]|nr:TIGR01777 family oxidoreductase [Gallionella sp.]
MRILMTGGTGLIGRRLCRELRDQGHALTVLSRRPETVAAKCGAGVQAMRSLEEWLPEQTFDAVINLAGEPIADAHWTAARKQALWDSRVTLTEALVRKISAAQHKPAVLLSGSAIGFYGNGEMPVDESAQAANDFAGQLCRVWEDVALAAQPLGVRVCLLRTGLVLAPQGGLLGRLWLPFKLGLGARLGDGRQWMSWVHLDDHVAMVLKLLQDESLSGPFNLTAPAPVTNADFTRALARAVHRPAWFFAPAALLRLILGERASLLLEGQRVLPERMHQLGFQHRYPLLEDALRDVSTR